MALLLQRTHVRSAACGWVVTRGNKFARPRGFHHGDQKAAQTGMIENIGKIMEKGFMALGMEIRFAFQFEVFNHQ